MIIKELAIDGHRMQQKEPYKRLAEINRAITTSLNFDEVLQLIVKNVTQLVDARITALVLIDKDGTLRIRAAEGLDQSVIDSFAGRMEEDVIRELHQELSLGREESFVTVPIIAKNVLNGLLLIARDEPLTEEEEWQLGALSDQAAIALRNARLYEMELAEASRERDETLEALRESNKRIYMILESITDLFYALDREWRFVDVNRNTEAKFGKSREELLGNVIWEIYPHAVDSDLYPNFQRAMKEMRPQHFELESKIVPGVWFEVHAYPSQDGLTAYLRDITERRKAEEEIRFQAHLLSTVEQAVIATDLNGHILYWNTFAERLYGWKAEEAVSLNVLDTVARADSREKAAEIMTRLQQGESWSGEILLKTKDGTEFPAMVTDSPIIDKDERLIGIVGVSIDISERKRAEKERAELLEREREARTEAEKANQLKDEFLATLSHELRNPLNVILGYSEVLLRSEEAKKSTFLKPIAEILKRNALAQSQLVSDLLDLSRLHTGKVSLNREPVSLITIVNNAVETVRADAVEKSIQITVDSADDKLIVDGDPLRLEQVVWNLLNNAVKFTAAHGSIAVRLQKSDNEAALSVTDTGVGIDHEFLPHVFEMFRQADATSSRSHAGLGIGLALVRQLVELHQGNVAVASDGIGRGAEFTIRLPLSLEEKRSRVDAEEQVSAQLHRLRILVVDDSEDTTEMLRGLFELDGATVVTASRASEALEIARSKEFDVILTDISMPEMDGFELFRRLREIPHTQKTPVVALTGFGRAEDIERAKSEGFLAHITKPIDVVKLTRVLREIDSESGQAAAK